MRDIDKIENQEKPFKEKRKLAAIMFTDIVGYATLMSEDEQKARRLLQKNREILKLLIKQFNGEWLKELGDGSLSSFESALEAVKCAIEIQKSLRADPELKLRIGIHIGDVVFEAGDVFGHGVNVASRIEPLAEPGGICISKHVRDKIRNFPNIKTVSLGLKELKNVYEPLEVYKVLTEGALPSVADAGKMEKGQVKVRTSQKKRAYLFGAIAGLLIVVFVALYFFILPKQPTIERKSIAVLPFKNMVPDPENEWFSDGITEDIITQLSKIGDLKVICRTSVMLYKDIKKRLREIGKELDVATILEGSVRRTDNRVRIVSQLVDARTEEHIWAETYDRDLSDIFAIQSDVAQQIAEALKATLSLEEKERIEQKPTDNLEAYDYFLQAREYGGRSYEKNDLEIAIELFEKAVRADPNFAEAYASMARQHCRMYWYGFDRSPERLGKAKEAIDKALHLKPDESLVREANGYYYYWGFRDYARALDEFTFALQKDPGNALYNASIAFIQRRLGKFQDALQNLKIAFQYDPRAYSLAKELGYTCDALRMYTEAEEYYDRAISLAPDLAENYINKAWTNIYKTGSTKSAKQVLDNALKRVDLEDLIWDLVYLDIYDGHYQDALDKLTSIQKEVREGQTHYTPKEAIYGGIYELMGQPDQARTHYEKARALLEKMVRERPDDARMHAELGKVYAYLGLKDEAINEGETAVDLIPVSRDAMIGPDYLACLAEICTIVREYDAAIEKLEHLLEIPAGVPIGDLKVNPVWAPLRDHPRFQRLLEGEK